MASINPPDDSDLTDVAHWRRPVQGMIEEELAAAMRRMNDRYVTREEFEQLNGRLDGQDERLD